MLDSHLWPWPRHYPQRNKTLHIVNFVLLKTRLGSPCRAIFPGRTRRQRTGWTGRSRVDFRGCGSVSGAVGSKWTLAKYPEVFPEKLLFCAGSASHLLSNFLPGITSRPLLEVVLFGLIDPIKWVSDADFLFKGWASISIRCISFDQHD